MINDNDHLPQVRQHGVPGHQSGGWIHPGHQVWVYWPLIGQDPAYWLLIGQSYYFCWPGPGQSNINVAVTPRAKIRFWRNLEWNNIHLGDDVFLECEVQANPTVYNVTWRHNVSIISTISVSIKTWIDDSWKIILSTISRYHDRGLSKLFAVVVKSSQWQFLLISPKLLICCPSPDCRSDILFPVRLPQDTFADWKFLLNSSSCEIYINFWKQKRKFV